MALQMPSAWVPCSCEHTVSLSWHMWHWYQGHHLSLFHLDGDYPAYRNATSSGPAAWRCRCRRWEFRPPENQHRWLETDSWWWWCLLHGARRRRHLCSQLTPTPLVECAENTLQVTLDVFVLELHLAMLTDYQKVEKYGLQVEDNPSTNPAEWAAECSCHRHTQRQWVSTHIASI